MATNRLAFHKKIFPIRIIKRFLLLLLIFAVALVAFETYINYEGEKVIIAKTTPTIPLLSVTYLDTYNTDLYGYTEEMNGRFMRDALILLPEDRTFTMTMNLDGYKVNSMSYEVRSLNTSRKISSKEISYTKKGGALTANIQIENLIDKGEEFLLIITAASDEQTVRYYTRILQPENCFENECLEFANYIHETALSDNYMDLSPYMEPENGVNKDTLWQVDIHSTMDQIGYKDFDGEIVGDVTTSIADISPNFTAVTNYFLMARGPKSKREYYTVREYFRVRYTADRMYLLDYSRNMEEILTDDVIEFEDNLVNVGVTNPEVEYLSNETGTVVAFVQSGELFLYNQTERRLSRVFSFIGDNLEDKRAIYDQHSIKILNIDESGTMDYVIIGYMNSGKHEGKCGINLYHYDSITDMSTEQAFIESDNSYQILNSGFSQFIYETADRILYLMIDGTLIRMNLEDMSSETIMSEMSDSQFAVSNSGRYLSYIDSDEIGSTIYIIDLEQDKRDTISAVAGSYLIPLTYMGDDLIYGEVYANSITSDTAGNVIYPMHSLHIVEQTGSGIDSLMNYSKPGFYVTDVELNSYTLTLKRAVIEDDILSPTSNDTIQYSAGEQNKAVPTITRLDDIRGEIVLLCMAELDEDQELGKIAFNDSDMIEATTVGNITFDSTISDGNYYVYVGSQVILSTENVRDAIFKADENMGIVIDSSSEYIWKRGRSGYRNTIRGFSVGSFDTEAVGTARALSALLNYAGENVQVHRLLEAGNSPVSIMSRTLKDNKVLDLTGITLQEALYYVDQGTPVYAQYSEDSAYLLVGYDAATVIVFDPMTDKDKRINLNEASEMFDSYGNVFAGYLK